MTTPQDIEQSRAEFEAFLRTHEQEVGALDEPSAWAGWQAARSAPAASVELPEPDARQKARP